MEEKKTKFDNLLEAIKNNRFFAIIILAGVIIAGIASFSESLQKISLLFSDEEDNDLAVNISLINDTIEISEENFLFDIVKEVALRYDIVNKKDSIFIEPVMPYLSKIKNNTPISPISVFEMADSLQLPTIDLKIVNNMESTVFFTDAVFEIKESITDPWPILIIDDECKSMIIPIANIGWGDVYNCQVNFNIIKPTETPNFGANYNYKIDVGQFSTYYKLDLKNAFSQEGVDVNTLRMRPIDYWLNDEGIYIYRFYDYNGNVISFTKSENHQRVYDALGPFRESDKVEYTRGKAIVYGEISFSGMQSKGKVQNETIRFVTDISLYQWGEQGAGIPVDSEYQIEFDADRKNYEKSVPISQALKPGEVDRFTVAIKASKSSIHRFKIQLKYNDGNVYESKPILLKIFVPRNFLREPD
jgi:hypothetical protein